MAGWQFCTEPTAVPKVETNHRRIVTAIPPPEGIKILADLEAYESRAMHGQMPVIWDRAEGYQVSDPWGNRWIDFTSTIFVANAGHGNPRIVERLREQLDRPLLHTYTYASRIRSDYIRKLIEVTPCQFEKAFLLSAGTEATECAMKLMRMHGWNVGKGRPGIVTLEGNWHGRTLGAQMMSHNPAQKEWVGYHDPNIHHLPFPYPWCDEAMEDPRGFFRRNMELLLERKKLNPAKDLCGFLLESFQGWGALFYPAEFVQEISLFAKENSLLLAFDEMQAGFGRTGVLFGYMHYGVEPDLLCCGKGASSSLPLSIVLGSREVMDLPEIGSMSSTHSANPMVCAAGMGNLEALLQDGLIEHSRVLGEEFHRRLQGIRERYPEHISYVTGRGLLAALLFTDPEGRPLIEACNEICQEAMRQGLLVVHTGRESIKLAPPLSIPVEAMDEGLDVLEASISSVLS